MSNRRAFTLIEMVLVIAIFALILGAIAALFQGVFRASRTMQSHRGSMNSIQRLATQFRDDIHLAASAQRDDGKLAIHHEQDKIVVYTAAESALERTVESDGKVVHRDTFDLPPAASATFEFQPSGDNRLVSLVVAYPLDATQAELSDRRTLRIDAAMGLAHPKLGGKKGER